ncbi:hypothetical protein [Terriglobus roseus]|uniref:Uncharacterized protein n=1 Tax=Terriglobus roseus TaxID=392734 RepID=A0A1G7QBK7_9BACT|nr:hypothetical protein [Terriglobus roseus]SDF95941.1 hypothetical protein SAMN05444167_3823 [Terriglobus roseus]
MILAWCIAATVCAATMAATLLTPSVRRSSGKLSITQLWLLTLLVIPGQVLPPILLWLAWKRTYYIIPFLGPPIRVGMAPVAWALCALFFSYLPATVYALRGQWQWFWLLVHPAATFRMLWRQWGTDHEIQLQKNVD